MPTVQAWLADARERKVQPNPDAMVVATATPDGKPSARVVLCKKLIVSPGYVVFFTNYDSRKGQELAANPHIAAVLHWDELARQVRLEGRVVRAPPEESDEYFALTRARQPHRRMGQPAEPAARFTRDAVEARRNRSGATWHVGATSAALGRLSPVAGSGRTVDGGRLPRA